MTADERITTLILHGVAMWRSHGAPRGTGWWRYLYHRHMNGIVQPVGAILKLEDRRSTGTTSWRIIPAAIRLEEEEIPFDAGLIETIPEGLFQQYIAGLAALT